MLFDFGCLLGPSRHNGALFQATPFASGRIV